MIKIKTKRGEYYVNEEKIKFAIFVNDESFIISKEAFKKLLNIKE